MRSTYGVRYIPVDGKTVPVFTEVLHTDECRYGQGHHLLTPHELDKIHVQGVDTIVFTAHHAPPRSVWRACKVCKPGPV